MKKPTKLTRRQAWLLIARMYERPRGDKRNLRDCGGDVTRSGLGRAVWRLGWLGKIAPANKVLMRGQIQRELEGRFYLFPIAPRYRPHRARIARKFAKEAAVSKQRKEKQP